MSLSNQIEAADANVLEFSDGELENFTLSDVSFEEGVDEYNNFKGTVTIDKTAITIKDKKVFDSLNNLESKGIVTLSIDGDSLFVTKNVAYDLPIFDWGIWVWETLEYALQNDELAPTSKDSFNLAMKEINKRA